ncbi:MAG: formyltransferase family protein [Deinococcota bacterium]
MTSYIPPVENGMHPMSTSNSPTAAKRHRLQSVLSRPPLRVVFIGTNTPMSTSALMRVMLQEEVVAVVESAPFRYQPSRLKRIRKELSEARRLRYGQVFLSWLARYKQLPYLFYYPARQAELYDLVERVQADVICVVTMNSLLKPEVFNLPRLGAINVHPSLLPQYRGANPFFWQYYYMDLQGGVTVHQIDAGMDTGAIFEQEELQIPLGMPLKQHLSACENLTNTLLTRTLSNLRGGYADPKSQPEGEALVRAKKVKPGEVAIDWESWPLERAWHLLRGFQGALGLLPPAGRFRRWQVGEMAAGERSRTPLGQLGRDRNGQFVQHAEGKIRLDVRWQMRP